VEGFHPALTVLRHATATIQIAYTHISGRAFPGVTARINARFLLISGEKIRKIKL
jgi:hypothetical protein